MNNTQNTPNTNNNDEIDLFELIITLWKSKALIIGITLLSTIIAGLIAFFVLTPEFKATTIITQPQPYQIEKLNIGLTQGDSKNNNFPIKPMNVEGVFKILTNTLNSKDLQRQFFRSNFLPNQNKTTIEDNQRGFAAFQKMFSISGINKDNNQVNITFSSDNPKFAYNLVNEYLDLANATAVQTILKNRTAEINSAIYNLESAIKSLESELKAQNSFRLSQLKNAYETAKKLNILAPQEKGTELFQQGTEALTSQISFLESQLENYTGNREYNELTSQLVKYKAITQPSASEITPYSIDLIAEIPENPEKPNKKLIIIIGFLLGGMLAVMFVLLRQSIRNYKLRNPKMPEAHSAY